MCAFVCVCGVGAAVVLRFFLSKYVMIAKLHFEKSNDNDTPESGKKMHVCNASTNRKSDH